MSFLAKTPSPNEWKIVSNAVSTLVEEASFEATAEGLTFRAMDPSHVALVDLEWPNSAFEKYSCDKQFKFTVRVEDLAKLIKRAEAKDSVEVSTAGEGETLLLRISDGYKREFNIHLVESTYTPTPVPKLTFKTKILVAEQIFEKMLNDVSAVSDHVTMHTTSDRIVFSGKSETGEGSVTLERGSPDLLELTVEEETRATYSIDYLLNIAKAAGRGSDVVTCEYANKMPLRLTFRLSEQGGRIHFYLAPRVEER